MTSSEKMALWSTFNALLQHYSPPNRAGLTLAEVQAWWERYESELQLERAYLACQKNQGVWE